VTNLNGIASGTDQFYWGSRDTTKLAESAWSYIYLEVPEPSTLAVFGFSLGVFAWLRKFKR
jgi:hypothetical protein